MSRNGRPPTGIYSPYQVIKVEPGKPVKFICVSRDWETVDTHWYGKHSVQCRKPEPCICDGTRMDTVWKAYLLGTAPSGGNVAVFQLTPLAAYMLEEQTQGERGLLGAIICLTRKGTRVNSPLEASIRGWVDNTDEKPFEVLERVVRLLYREYAKLKVNAVEAN